MISECVFCNRKFVKNNSVTKKERKRSNSYLNERKTIYNSTEINRGCDIFRRDQSKRDVILYISQSVPNHIGRRGIAAQTSCSSSEF